jgi:sugar/nucleoside kinase (ribokinase family)
MILKLGERGIIGYRRNNVTDTESELSSFFVLDPFLVNVVDPVGSGDALLSYAGLSDFVSNDTVIAAILGALAAACACEVDGNHPIFTKDMHKMLHDVESRLKYHEEVDK